MDFNEQATEIFSRHLAEWESDPVRMQSGYHYEMSYAVMMRKVERDILQLSVGNVPRSKNTKKNSTPGSGR